MSIDRYEKRHKNLAAHVSPAFRVEAGDLVTVGMSLLQPLNEPFFNIPLSRPMQTAIKDRPIQRHPCKQEQGCGKDVWQVLNARGMILVL